MAVNVSTKPASRSLTKVVPAACMLAGWFTMGCGGPGTAGYWGTIVTGGKAGYAFQPLNVVPTGTPVSGAQVTLRAGWGADHCRNLPPFEKEKHGELARFQRATSDANGQYSVAGVIAPYYGSQTRILLCVTHPEYQDFEYSAMYDETKDPVHTDVHLNISLVKK